MVFMTEDLLNCYGVPKCTVLRRLYEKIEITNAVAFELLFEGPQCTLKASVVNFGVGNVQWQPYWSTECTFDCDKIVVTMYCIQEFDAVSVTKFRWRCCYYCRSVWKSFSAMNHVLQFMTKKDRVIDLSGISENNKTKQSQLASWNNIFEWMHLN